MGRTTGLQCGTIKNNCINKYSEVQGHPPYLILCTITYRRDADEGDSGGSIFYKTLSGGSYYVTILGTHVHSQDDYAPTGGVGWYTPWDRGITELEDRFPALQLTPCFMTTCGL